MRLDTAVMISICIIMACAPNVLAVDSGGLEKTIDRNVSFLHSRAGEQVFSVRVDNSSQLKVVLAHDKVDGPRETVVSMCRRYHCLAAVNGDFYGGNNPHGGIISEGHIYRTPHQESGQVWFGESLDFVEHPSNDFVKLTQSNGRIMQVPLNVVSKRPISSMFNQSYGGDIPILPKTGTYIYQCICRERPDLEGRKYNLRLIRTVHNGPVRLLRNQVALSLLGHDGMNVMATSHQLTQMRLPDVKSTDAIGAHPVLLSRGRIRPTLTNFFATSLHPRTVLARNNTGRAWLIAIDSRVSLTRAAQIAQKLGATEAINMDGGGSTTFVVHGKTLNNPADKAERAVASAILVVKKPTIYHKKAALPVSQSSKSIATIKTHLGKTYLGVKDLIPDQTNSHIDPIRYALYTDQGGDPFFGFGTILILMGMFAKRYMHSFENYD